MAKYEFKKGDTVAITYVGNVLEDVSTNNIDRIYTINSKRVDAYLVERADTRKVGDLYALKSVEYALYQYLGDDRYRLISYSDGRPGPEHAITTWSPDLIAQAIKMTLNYGE